MSKMAVIREKTLQECSHLTDFDSGFSEMEEANNLPLYPTTQTPRSKYLSPSKKSLEAVLKPDPTLKLEAQKQFLSSIVQQLKAKEQKVEGCVSSAHRQRGWALFRSLQNPRAALAEAGPSARGAGRAPESLTETVQVTGRCHGPASVSAPSHVSPRWPEAQPVPSAHCPTRRLGSPAHRGLPWHVAVVVTKPLPTLDGQRSGKKLPRNQSFTQSLVKKEEGECLCVHSHRRKALA